mmetsp:Transcript_15679/g.34084  ORF Transcript_15679/g.34084 Transcript_15679/m.34084 type:complete len:338 (+) Transcript_15679:739-1752(+)
MLLDNVPEAVLQVVDGQLLVLGFGHCTDDLTEHSDEHVHDRQGCEKHKDVEQREEDEVQILLNDQVHHGAEAVEEDAIDHELVHGAGYGGEVMVANCCVCCQLLEDDCEDVQQNHQQHQCEDHRSDCGDHPFDEDQDFRHGAQEPSHSGHPRKSQKAKHLDHGGAAEVHAAPTARSEQDDGHYPSFEDHQTDHDGVEDEPSVGQALVLQSECSEAKGNFQCEVEAEEVLCHDEDRIGLNEDVGVVKIGVYRDPKSVECDDRKRGVLKDVVHGHLCAEALLIVERRDIVPLFLDVVAKLFLHVVRIYEHLLLLRGVLLLLLLMFLPFNVFRATVALKD